MSTPRARSRFVAGAAFAVALVTSPAAADVTVQYATDGEADGTMYIGKTHVSIHHPEGKLVFNGEAESVTMSADGQTYTMTRDQLQQMSAMRQQSTDVMGKLGDLAKIQREAALSAIEQLPEAEREKARAEIERAFPDPSNAPAADAETTVAPSGNDRTVHGVKAKGYTVSKGGQPVGNMWVASLKDVGLDKDDLAVFTKLRAFVSELDESGPTEMLGDLARMDPTSDDFLGFIVAMENDGENVEVVSVKKGKVDPSVY